MPDWITYIVLAIGQGLTEFLPVSSSGHLVLLNFIFPDDPAAMSNADAAVDLFFDLVLHVATLISVCIFYRKYIGQLAVEGCRELYATATKREKAGPNLLMVLYLLAATVITGTIGLCFDDIITTHLRTPLVVGILLIINAFILLASQKPGKFKTCDGNMNLKTALIIGLVQGIAVLPGISRSGSTITASLLMGVEAKYCARFSFLLSIPVILGGFLLHMFKLNPGDLPASSVPMIIISALIAAAVGYACLVLLERMLKNAKFYRFAPYCFVVGVAAIVLSFFR